MLLQYHNLTKEQRAIAQSIQCATIYEGIVTKWDEMKQHCKPSFVEGVEGFLSKHGNDNNIETIEKFIEYIENEDRVLELQFHEMAEMAAMNVLYTTDASKTVVINLDRHKYD